MEREADMNSTAVKCLHWGVLECVKSKTHDECALVEDESMCVCLCVVRLKAGRTDRVVYWVV